MAKETISHKLERLLKNQNLFPHGAVLIAACSGGADSLAMTSLLQQVGREKDWQVFVCHVQHHLRGDEAEKDALFVENFCHERHLPFIRVDVEVLPFAEKNKLSVEEAARKLRYSALKDNCRHLGAVAIVTGHHQDDQAETVLLNLLRGAGNRGLRGMQVRNGLLVRPFLAASRSEMEEYCREQGIEWCTDSSNECIDYRRNRIRKELLPMLEEYNPQIKRALAKTASLAGQDQEFLDALAADYLSENAKKTKTDYKLNVKEFAALPPALAARVLLLAFSEALAKDDCQLESKHIEALVRLVKAGRSGSVLALPGGRAEYAYGFLTISRQVEAAETHKFAEQLAVPGELRLPDGSLLSVDVVIGDEPVAAKNKAVYPRRLVTGIIEVRNRENGDRFRPKGSGAKKLKEYLIDRKMPRAEREQLLLVCAGKEVLWLVGGQAAGWKEDNSFQEWLLFEISEGGK